MKERLKARKDKREKERRDLSHHFVRPSQNLSVVAMETSLLDKGHACVTGRVKSSIVVALDLKGFGDSDKPTRRRSYRIEVLINELRQFISTLGVDKCSIIGHDLGGLLGWVLRTLHSMACSREKRVK
ncbi:Similar to EPHX4: Epoxide hydrolase 4 (Homo sapiens) [Cotesia congregata]|uniref:Similar to EPHX4: Epoxide hydrolase 4 (Homo sapiens) n=1 Tax=Cotesia congregata TaxID=51543 RepID=A0A8J2HKA2_COTCN|nr:Similar to EPHX4: Epoxide hydrolase 4 (Homo sapiens) [Cotesia congregata]